MKSAKEKLKQQAIRKEKHAHTYDGKPMYGVTTVLGVVSKGDGLIQWSAHNHPSA